MYPAGGKWGKQIKEATFKKADTGSTVIIKLYAGMVCNTTTTKK